jgi:hypothetical protein
MLDRVKARVIALYLPQFHPIPENDAWWGTGFTEWTNVARARRLFPGHYQPRVPADLGFYDLRVPQVREAQARLARDHGIEGFCYWHYWFGGRRILERPFEEVLASGKPDFPFCLAWANESWSGIWHGAPDRILLKQTYPGPEDDELHFRSVLPAMLDDRYIKIDERPIFVIYRPRKHPELRRFTDHWRRRALESGLKGMYFIGIDSSGEAERENCLDAVIPYLPRFENLRLYGLVPPRLRDTVRGWIGKLRSGARHEEGDDLPMVPPNFWPQTYSYREFVRKAFSCIRFDADVYPLVVPNWDNTPRCGMKGGIFADSTPELFAKHLRQAIALVADRDPQRRLVFIRSWNEWAEGNHLEPDLKFGLGYLEAVRTETAEASR